MVNDEIPGCEADLGMEVFLTTTRGVGGRLKRFAEDFVVQEISNHPPQVDGGRYVVAKVTATNWEMNRLVRHISRSLGISRNLVHFAGTKDKRAVTTQLMTMEADAQAVRDLHIHQVLIEDVYTSNKRLNIGDLVGNRFQVKVRDTVLQGEELRTEASATKAQLDQIGGYPNFFGLQRFGSVRPITHLVGREIVRNDMEGAVMWYVGNPNEDENQEAQEARRRLQETRDFEEALRTFPSQLTFERTVIGYLVRNPGDYVGAIRVLPGNLQMMFVHAYQSYMFNRILSERLRRGMPLDRPLVGDVVLPADKNGLPDHDKYVPVTDQNLDLVQRHVRDRKAFVIRRAVRTGQRVLHRGDGGDRACGGGVRRAEAAGFQGAGDPGVQLARQPTRAAVTLQGPGAEGRRGRAGRVVHAGQGLLRHRPPARDHEVRDARLLIHYNRLMSRSRLSSSSSRSALGAALSGA